MKKIAHSSLVALTAGAFALSSLGMASNAIAQDTAEVNASLVNQLNKGDEATLTIHKIAGGFQGTNQWGVEKDVAGTPLDGVAFDIYRVPNVDLTTVQGWHDYNALQGKALSEFMTPENKVDTVKTANGGVAKYTTDVGVYVVAENLDASDESVKGKYSPAAPFMTALPFTTENGGSWNRNVHVYPKNQENNATKTVADKGTQASQQNTYTISGSVPTIPANHEGKYFDGYSLLDIFETGQWEPNKDTIEAYIKVGEKRTALEAGDFQVSDTVDYADEAGKQAFTISLTRAGLDKLETAVKGAGTTQVRLEADVKGAVAKGVDVGDLVNKATVFPPNIAEPNWDRSKEPDDPNTPPTTPPEETEVVSKYGAIDILKVSSENNEKTLAGATFELHKCVNGGKRGEQSALLDEKNSQPVKVGGNTEWTTGADGKLTITGIQLEDWYDGDAQTDEFDYCLVETKAPEGFELLPKPINAQVNQATLGATEGPVTSVEFASLNVENVPTTTQTFKLPATGEWGRWWLIGGGTLALLVAAGFTVQAVNRRGESAI